jgi:hypothetical protein
MEMSVSGGLFATTCLGFRRKRRPVAAKRQIASSLKEEEHSLKDR